MTPRRRSPGKWYPTAQLRFVERQNITMSENRSWLALQQFWKRDGYEGGEWRDVPLERAYGL